MNAGACEDHGRVWYCRRPESVKVAREHPSWWLGDGPAMELIVQCWSVEIER